MKGKYPVVPKIPLAFVHVDDVATAHRMAYENDDANGRYVLAPYQDAVSYTHLRAHETDS